MKKALYFIFGLSNFLTVAQETANVDIPNITPKTPEAAAFLKYGEYPVDLSTGVPEISIPLYTIEEGGFKLPITLNYHASGIKVAQEATWVGLGWNLNFGAQIILNVKDDVDENNSFVHDMPNQNVMDYYVANPYVFNGGPVATQQLDKSRIKDMYSFSSPTASGTFFWDAEQNKYVTIPPDAPFKVENAQLMAFKITDNQGNIYKFSTKEISYRIQIPAQSVRKNYTSAWYVDEIETAENKKIQFNYQADGAMYDYSTLQQFEIKRHVQWAHEGGNSGAQYTSTYRPTSGTTITAAKKIHEIIFNNGFSKVVFGKNESREDLAFNTTLNSLTPGKNGSLQRIQLMHQTPGDPNFQLVKTYQFNYSYFNPTLNGVTKKRLKLNSLSVLPDGDTHQFVYNAAVLPDKKSNAQDYYGYYNGRGGGNMVPKHIFDTPTPTVYGGADRRVDPTVNQAGMLEKIYYPSKGYTKFSYETNQYYGQDKFAYLYPTYVSQTCDVLGTTAGIGSANPNPNQIQSCSISFTATTSFTLSYNTLNELHPNPQGSPLEGDAVDNKYHFTRIRIYIDGDMVLDRTSRDTESHTLNFTQTGNVVITYQAYGWSAQIHSAGIHYYDGSPKNLYAAGLRIKSIENLDHDGVTLLSKKNYTYNNLTTTGLIDPDKTSGQLINPIDLDFVSQAHTSYVFGSAQGYPAVQSTRIFNIMSESRNPVDGNIVYKYVQESDVDVTNGTDKGYTLYEFTTDGDLFQLNAGLSIASVQQNRGKVLKKSVFKRISNNQSPYYLPIQEEVNTYFDDASRISSLKGFKLVRYGSTELSGWHAALGIAGAPLNAIDLFRGVFYDYTIPWKYLKTRQLIEKFYDSSNNLVNTVTTLNTYDYNNPLHQQLSTQRTTTSAGEVIETKYFYPNDSEVASEPNVSGTTGLIARNMIARPLLVKTLNAGTVLSEKKTEYAVYPRPYTTIPGDYTTSLFPKFIYTKKGTNAFEKNITYDYDDLGNIRQYTQENGVPVSIIWGYNKTRPIAKIENAAYSSINATQIDNAQSSSNTGNEAGMLTAFNSMRNDLPNAMISTYTYYPLVGVKSITDPKGDTLQYFYDENGRLTSVKDKDGNILSENQYHYKN